MNAFFTRLMSALACALVFVCVATGQEVHGTVSDTTGAVIPGARVQILSAGKSSRGFWLAPALDWSPSEYFVNNSNTAVNSQYAVVSLKSGFDWRNWGSFMESANLTDRNYSASVQVDAANGRFYEPANGRSVYGGVRWYF